MEAVGIEQTLRWLIQSVPDAMVLVDRCGRIQAANVHAERIFDHLPDGLPGVGIETLVPRLVLDQAAWRNSGSPDGRVEPCGLVLQARRADGSEFLAEVSLSSARLESLELMSILIRDVSDQQTGAQRGRLAPNSPAEIAHRRLAAIVESSEDAILSLDLDGRITGWNPGAVRIYGYQPGEIIGESIRKLCPAQDVERPVELIARIRAGERIQHYETTRLRRDGTTMEVSLTLSPIRDADGRVVGVSSISRDITERKCIEASLRESELRFRSVTESVTDAIISADVEGYILSWNDAARALFGYAAHEVLGRSLLLLIPERYRPAHLAALGRARERGELRLLGKTLEMHGTRKDGSEFPMEIRLGSWRTDRGMCVSAIVRDITARLQAEEAIRRLNQDLELRVHQRTAELQRLNEELSQFAYVASHDLQEPLRMVASYGELLARRYQDRLDADAHEFIGYMVEGASRMHQMINDLLAYSRLTSQQAALAPVALKAVLQSALELLQPAIQESGAKVTHGRLPTLRADASKLVRVFQNLVGNAIRFRGEQPPRIDVRAARAKDKSRDWIISVRDNGIGIAREHAERIFVVFQRLHRRSEYPGTGIGLAICRKIVQEHGGRIWVESRPGAGSVFRFTLPSAPEGER